MSTASFLTVCMNPTLQKTLRFSALIPDTVNRTSTHRVDASGKGVNVSRVLTQLGKPCLHLTQLGESLRPLFLDRCEQDGVALEWVESKSSIRFCYTLINDADASVTELVEEAEPVKNGTEARLMAAYRRLLPGYETVIISGTMAAGFSAVLVPSMVRHAKESGHPVILDLRGRDLVNSLEYTPDVIKPNLFEFAGTFAPELVVGNRLIDHTAEGGAIKNRIREICRALCEQYHCRIVLTRGAESVWYAEPGSFGEYAVERVKPLNTTGSGDAFTAGLAASLMEEATLRDAVAWGVHCGGLNAGLLKVGAIR
ncbi:MAG: PfkB family carbohydrate kinase [Treponema sp.]|jgi:1-phosphofructokinase/tagatose 6-phosphate kinase|nr:PfkB family carbohydrate kinase [Treponema sp.]